MDRNTHIPIGTLNHEVWALISPLLNPLKEKMISAGVELNSRLIVFECVWGPSTKIQNILAP